MFSLGGSEILLLALVALVLFGNQSLPANMKKLVKGLNEVKKVAGDAQRSWNEVRDDITRQIMADDAEEQAKKELAEIKRLIESNPNVKAEENSESGSDTQIQVSGSQAALPDAVVERQMNPKQPHEQDDNEPYYERPEDDPNHKVPEPLTENSVSESVNASKETADQHVPQKTNS